MFDAHTMIVLVPSAICIVAITAAMIWGAIKMYTNTKE
jgi:hypothetical protein